MQAKVQSSQPGKMEVTPQRRIELTFDRSEIIASPSADNDVVIPCNILLDEKMDLVKEDADEALLRCLWCK